MLGIVLQPDDTPFVRGAIAGGTAPKIPVSQLRNIRDGSKMPPLFSFRFSIEWAQLDDVTGCGRSTYQQ